MPPIEDKNSGKWKNVILNKSQKKDWKIKVLEKYRHEHLLVCLSQKLEEM